MPFLLSHLRGICDGTSPFLRTLIVVASTAVMLHLLPVAIAANGSSELVVRDFIGRTWRNELVTFALSEDQARQARAGNALLGSDGKAVPYQLVRSADRAPSRIALLTDLDPFERRAFSFSASRSSLRSDVQIEETAEAITIGNSRVAVRIRTALTGNAGPIAGVRVASSRWIADSTLAAGLPVTAYRARVTARGPVYTEVVCDVTIGGQSTWQLRIRLLANEPVVLFDEVAAVDTPASFVLMLNRNFDADSILYRRGLQEIERIGVVETARLAGVPADSAFTLEPWLQWQRQVRRGTWFGVYGEHRSELVAVGALRPDLWVNPAIARDSQAEPRLALSYESGALRLTFPIKHGQRGWLLGIFDKNASLAMASGKERMRAPPPQQSVIKHGNFPLDVVNDYILQWQGEHDNHPRLLITRSDLPELRARVQATTSEKPLVTFEKTPLQRWNLDAPIRAFLATGDADLGRRISELAVEWMQRAVDMYTVQDTLVSFGFAPHHQYDVIRALTLADVALGARHLTPAERERIRAQVAFLGYTLVRKDYWDPERGFSANPNMTTMVHAYIVAAAAFIPSHPHATTWAKQSLDELLRQLNEWSDENGGWLEAPHYALVAYDMILGAFIMARNSGFGDYVFAPKMRKVIEWLAKISTPPDSRIGGYRHLPAIGNTYLHEPTGEFGTVAYLWRRKDPAFASHMQWMHRQMNSFAEPGIGGAYPSLEGFRSLLSDPSIPAVAPAWGSELFPNTGVILRNAFSTARETQLHMILGANHAHYDDDSGSITLYGKGRVLADDFGYYGYAPAEDHSMVDSRSVRGARIVTLREFRVGPSAEYVAVDNGNWTRQILFLKDTDPLGPNYYVVNDAVRAPEPATWRIWFTANQIRLGTASAMVDGREDVDLDLVFTRPLTTRTEEKTRRSSSGLHPDWRWGPLESTQIGVVAPISHDRPITAILYPRLKSEKAPVTMPIAGGNGVKITHTLGVDYVFVSREPITYREADVAFSGTVGSIQLRTGSKPMLFLGAPGRITAGGQSLVDGRASSTPVFRKP